jgi:energy-coupling factor transport system permease protein
VVRGYGSARRPPRERRPWSRHDIAFAAGAAGLAALAAVAAISPAAGFEAYPELAIAVTPATWALAAAVAACALVPFLGRRGVAR